MIARNSTSYPFLAIAQYYNVPYWVVLEHAGYAAKCLANPQARAFAATLQHNEITAREFEAAQFLNADIRFDEIAGAIVEAMFQEMDRRARR